MTVSQLIEALSAYNPDATVDVYTPGYHGMGVTFNYTGISGPAHAATIHGDTPAEAATTHHAATIHGDTPAEAATTHHAAAIRELGLEDVPHETSHVEAATVHALLAIADQLRIANLLDLASQDPDELPNVDINTAVDEAITTLYDTQGIPAPYNYDNPSDDYTIAELTPDVANLLGIHRHEGNQA